MLELTDGNTTITAPGNKGHIREGVVVKSLDDANVAYYGQRKIAKSISNAYLLKSTGEEFS